MLTSMKILTFDDVHLYIYVDFIVQYFCIVCVPLQRSARILYSCFTSNEMIANINKITVKIFIILFITLYDLFCQ